jgi:hypothetical protein
VFRVHSPNHAEFIRCSPETLPAFFSDLFSTVSVAIDTKWPWTSATAEQLAMLHKEESTETPRQTLPGIPSYSRFELGWIYVLSNPEMPGIVKIGRTDRTPSERAAELSSATGIPTPFTLLWEEPTGNPEAAESEIHRLLDDKRINSGREFFRIDSDSAINAVTHVCTAFPPPGSCVNVDVQSLAREDDLFLRSVQFVKNQGSIDPRTMRIRFGMSYDESHAIFQKMQLLGFIDPEGNPTHGLGG